MNTNDPYARLAPLYDVIVEPVLGGARKVGLDIVEPVPEWHVLDVGCGTGTGLSAYADAGCTVYGVDVSKAMLAKAAARLGARAELHHTAGDRLPFDDDRFDLVLTSMVLHEVPTDARTQFVTEMARVAKPDGRLLIIDFRFGSLRGWKGPTFRGVRAVIERVSGHYSHYKTFKAAGGVPPILDATRLPIDREKIVGGGNVAIYVARPQE